MTVSLDFSRWEGIAFYWWGSGGGDQQIDFTMRSPTGSWVGRFYDGPAEWRWVFLGWDDFTEVGLGGSRPDRSEITGFFWTYHTDGVRRVDYIVCWRRQDLRGDFKVRHETGQNLLGRFETQATRALPGKGIIRHEAAVELLGKVDIMHSIDLLAKVGITHSVELLTKTVVRHSDSVKLLGKVDITFVI